MSIFIPDSITREQLVAAMELCESQDGWFSGNKDTGIIELVVFMSDTFAYACADSEHIAWEDVVELNEAVKSGDKFATIKYAMCHDHKGMVPIEPIRKLMEEADNARS